MKFVLYGLGVTWLFIALMDAVTNQRWSLDVTIAGIFVFLGTHEWRLDVEARKR